MRPRTLFQLAAALTFIVLVGIYQRDPHRTRLPFGTTDLSSVQQQLAKLPEEERTLVEDYVKRSRGDVLPAKFADPDDPLTARNFEEAIELQRKWQVKSAENAVKTAALQAEYQAKYEPLRAVVKASLIKAEIMTRSEFEASQNSSNPRNGAEVYQNPYASKVPTKVDNAPTFVTHIMIENLTNESIVDMRGALIAHDSQAVFKMDICWIDLGGRREILPNGSQVHTCSDRSGLASDQQRAFVENPEGRFELEWQPSYVKFSDGRELASGL